MSAVSGASAVGARRPASDLWALTLRVLLMYKNSPGLVGVSLGAPLVMLVVFGYVFGSAISVPDYRSYLMPGLFVTIAVNGIMASMIGAVRDLERGITDRLRTMPISRGSVLLGQSLADLGVNAVIFAATAGVGLAVGSRATDGIWRAIAAFGAWPLAHPVLATLGWYVVLLVVFIPLAVRKFSTYGR